jgi:23S rRNA (adenine2030-N6)-methyltransferase
MLSYRHGFHAGNHADVLKHLVQVALIDYLALKDTPFWYIDTHAGAGTYDLQLGFSDKNKEYQSGIARLWADAAVHTPPPLVANYLAIVRKSNPDGNLRYYPGSPVMAANAMAHDNKLRLFERHPADAATLAAEFSTQSKRTLVQVKDGFEGMKAFLPPPPRRALILIDPPYEEKEDYLRVVSALKEGLKRFATGTYAVWYPCLPRTEWLEMVAELKTLPVKSWLRVELYAQPKITEGFGMYGSGLFIINPPWTLAANLKETLPYLAKQVRESGAVPSPLLEVSPA